MPVTKDPRLPLPRGQITRQYGGRTITVTVVANGFEYLGEGHPAAIADVVGDTVWDAA